MNSAVAAPAGMTQAEFARQQGWAKSYVTKLKADGRLVLTADGLVDADASLAKIRGTSGALERAGRSVQGEIYAGAQDRERHYSAELKRLELERALGRVMPVDEVRACVDDAAAMLRSALESWSSRLPAQLASLGADERRIAALLADETEGVLRALADRFAALAEEAR